MFLFNQGPTRGLGTVQFHDYKPVFEANKNLPNVGIFIKQIALFREMLEKAGPDKAQDMDPSFSLPLGEMFSVVVYGQLILEQAKFDNIDPDVLNQIFDFMVRDFARFAHQIFGMHKTRDDQREYFTKIMMIRSAQDDTQYDYIWKKYVLSLNGEYEMNK
jgi:acyl-CoA dehydrogenase